MTAQQVRTATSSKTYTIRQLVKLKGNALLNAIEKDTSVQLLKACADMYMLSSNALLSLLHIPKSTITSRKTGLLNKDELNKVIRYVKLMDLAEKVLGTREAAIRWMDTPQPSLGGRKPNALLGLEMGRVEVENTLLAIEHGVYI